jgi:diaminohydroxyphosphoribosylaminopyrimidine deaminase/5-amino-6-(5-phosphoribosylamino)uracil reductase
MMDLQMADEVHLQRAITLAHRGLGSIKSNRWSSAGVALVGAVVARGDQVLGEGWYETYGGHHAEVNALHACGSKDLGEATLYVSLEPCCHHGKTPPCTDAILASGLRRVVIGSGDPTPKVGGQGIATLSAAGLSVSVAVGDLAAQARMLNQPFIKHAMTGRPWIVVAYAVGAIDNDPAAISVGSDGSVNSALVPQIESWRQEVDATATDMAAAVRQNTTLLVGHAGAFLPPYEQPRRIIFDWQGGLPVRSAVMTSAGSGPLTVVVGGRVARERVRELEAHGAQVVVVAGDSPADRLLSVLDQLGANGVGSLLLEATPEFAEFALQLGVADEVRTAAVTLPYVPISHTITARSRAVAEAMTQLRGSNAATSTAASDSEVVSVRLVQW